MLQPKKNINLVTICFMVNYALLLPFSTAFAEKPSPVISAFYCSSDEIPFIGELMPHMLSIMENPKVRTELNLTDDQLGKMKEVDRGFLAGVKEALTRNGNTSEVLLWNGGRSENHVMAIGKFSEDARKRTNAILKRQQLERMQEILLQLKGILSIPKKDIRPLLRLDAKQERSIDEIKSDIFSEIDKTASPDSVIASAGRCKFVISTDRKISTLMMKGEQSFSQLLSPEQKAIIEKLKGNPFSH